MVIFDTLSHKLTTLGLYPTAWDWLPGRPQSLRSGNRTSAMIIINTGTTQGCVFCPLHYSLFTHDCVASCKDSIILKFLDDMAAIGCFTGGKEAA